MFDDKPTDLGQLSQPTTDGKEQEDVQDVPEEESKLEWFDWAGVQAANVVPLPEWYTAKNFYVFVDKGSHNGGEVFLPQMTSSLTGEGRTSIIDATGGIDSLEIAQSIAKETAQIFSKSKTQEEFTQGLENIRSQHK